MVFYLIISEGDFCAHVVNNAFSQDLDLIVLVSEFDQVDFLLTLSSTNYCSLLILS